MALLNHKIYLCYAFRHSAHASFNTLKLVKDEYSISDVICICSIQNNNKKCSRPWRKWINLFRQPQYNYYTIVSRSCSVSESFFSTDKWPKRVLSYLKLKVKSDLTSVLIVSFSIRFWPHFIPSKMKFHKIFFFNLDTRMWNHLSADGRETDELQFVAASFSLAILFWLWKAIYVDALTDSLVLRRWEYLKGQQRDFSVGPVTCYTSLVRNIVHESSFDVMV